MGRLFAACLLFLLCVVLPASAQTSNRRHHREGALVDRRAAPLDRGALVYRRRAEAHRSKARVYRRRALTHRRGALGDREGVVDQEGLWIDQLPSAEFTPPSDETVPRPDKPIRSGVEVTLPSEVKDPPPKSTPDEPEALPPTESETPGQPPAEAEEPGATPPPAEAEKASSSIYWGATIGDQLTGTQAPWDMSAVSKFAGLAGKPLSLVNVFVPFANCPPTPCSFYKFAPQMMESIREYGAIPLYSWSSQSIPSSLEEPDFQLSDVTSGTYDSYIRSFAEEAREWGHPFFLRFDWEMNGGWFPWAEGANGNQPGEFVAAWRHVHDIFTAVGASNVNWVWCPNIDPDGIFQNLGPLYPGDEYVDWTGLDGYNWGTNLAKPDRWRSFDELYGSTYRQIADTIAPSKPLLIGEMSSTEYGGSKADWIRDTLAKIPANYPKIGGLLWFDTYIEDMDWPIESSSAAASAFAEGIANQAYAGNAYAKLAGTSIQPPPGP
ncbi:MAG TPA: glycosyl hydrolase [Solirubrobacterales bacterium]|nr:glycosyl hydrolase [Solirubrobacterales bacterium]